MTTNDPRIQKAVDALFSPGAGEEIQELMKSASPADARRLETIDEFARSYARARNVPISTKQNTLEVLEAIKQHTGIHLSRPRTQAADPAPAAATTPATRTFPTKVESAKKRSFPATAAKEIEESQKARKSSPFSPRHLRRLS